MNVNSELKNVQKEDNGLNVLNPLKEFIFVKDTFFEQFFNQHKFSNNFK